jgi:crotonobetainyl-CoA:carnitine CoA-transferase CaiB-like acyl-CoA transferase
MRPLEDIHILSVAINLPGPLAAARLTQLGASVTKIEPAEGDPLELVKPDWYASLTEGQQVVRMNLKEESGQQRMHELLRKSDLLLTSFRPATLERLGLGQPQLHGQYPQLCQVSIVGYPVPHENEPGHDLNYQARWGLVNPPGLPWSLIADIAGAQEAYSAALSLLFARERGQGSGYVQVSLAEAAKRFAEPLRYGLTADGGELGGGLPGYNLYACREGWIAVASLEPHFLARLVQELGLREASRDAFAQKFRTQSADEWEKWAKERDLPIVAVRHAAS